MHKIIDTNGSSLHQSIGNVCHLAHFYTSEFFGKSGALMERGEKIGVASVSAVAEVVFSTGEKGAFGSTGGWEKEVGLGMESRNSSGVSTVELLI